MWGMGIHSRGTHLLRKNMCRRGSGIQGRFHRITIPTNSYLSVTGERTPVNVDGPVDKHRETEVDGSGGCRHIDGIVPFAERGMFASVQSHPPCAGCHLAMPSSLPFTIAKWWRIPSSACKQKNCACFSKISHRFTSDRGKARKSNTATFVYYPHECVTRYVGTRESHRRLCESVKNIR